MNVKVSKIFIQYRTLLHQGKLERGSLMGWIS